MKNSVPQDNYNSFPIAADASAAGIVNTKVPPPSSPLPGAPKKEVLNQAYPGVMTCDRSRVESGAFSQERPMSSISKSNPSLFAATQTNPQPLPVSSVTIALMGATGTGKSTFINLLTNDSRIQIGHNPESETFDIQTVDYVDPRTGRLITLVDMPGSDDSRDDITDTDILEKVVRFLEPETGESRKLNGIIYMHRISDPRVGGVARKNLRMFQALCGDGNLGHVRIVTTNWSRVGEQEGSERQITLERGPFRALMDAGAQTRRHANTIESAQQIVSDFITLPPVTMLIQQELRAGKTLAATTAGIVLTAEMRELQQKHAKELADLQEEMEEAAEANDSALRAELEQERKSMEEQMARAEADQKRLGRTLERAHEDLAAEQNFLAESRKRIEQEASMLQTEQAETERAKKRLQDKIQAAQAQRQELERIEQEARASQDQATKLAKERDARRKDMEARHQDFQRALNGRSTQKTVKALDDQLKALEIRCQELEKSEHKAVENNRRLLEQLSREYEKNQSIEEKVRRLRRDEEELRQKQLRLHQKQAEAERKWMEIQRRDQQGGFGFFHNMSEVIAQCASVGGETAGVLSTVLGGAVRGMIAPGLTSAVNTIRGRT